MKVGSLVYATDQGLGILAKSFVDNGIITDPYVVRHSSHHTHDEWYPGAPQTSIRPFDTRKVREWANGMDVLLFLETPFDWMLIPYCRGRQIKTVLMTMHECTPVDRPAEPDLYLCPSALDLREFTATCKRCLGTGVPDTTTLSNARWRTKEPCPQHIHLPVPVSVQWRQRTAARVFVHNAGHGSFRDRNGTAKLLEALWLCDCLKGVSDARFVIRYQGTLPDIGPKGDFSGKLQWRNGTFSYKTLWDEGDVFVFPESFNGLSLPLQEARAAGMLVIATDRFPMNQWLPTPPLIKPRGFSRAKIGGPYMSFDEAQIAPEDIAAKIDEYYDDDIQSYSMDGKLWAEQMSWEKLGPIYRTVLEKLAAR